MEEGKTLKLVVRQEEDKKFEQREDASITRIVRLVKGSFRLERYRDLYPQYNIVLCELRYGINRNATFIVHKGTYGVAYTNPFPEPLYHLDTLVDYIPYFKENASDKMWLMNVMNLPEYKVHDAGYGILYTYFEDVGNRAKNMQRAIASLKRTLREKIEGVEREAQRRIDAMRSAMSHMNSVEDAFCGITDGSKL